MSITFSPETQDRDAPELNMANGNALALLALVSDTAPDYCGSWPATAIPPLIVKVSQILAGDEKHKFQSSTVTEGAVTTCGRSEAYVIDRLTALLEVLVYAQRHNIAVYWG